MDHKKVYEKNFNFRKRADKIWKISQPVLIRRQEWNEWKISFFIMYTRQHRICGQIPWETERFQNNMKGHLLYQPTIHFVVESEHGFFSPEMTCATAIVLNNSNQRSFILGSCRTCAQGKQNTAVYQHLTMASSQGTLPYTCPCGVTECQIVSAGLSTPRNYSFPQRTLSFS